MDYTTKYIIMFLMVNKYVKQISRVKTKSLNDLGEVTKELTQITNILVT